MRRSSTPRMPASRTSTSSTDCLPIRPASAANAIERLIRDARFREALPLSTFDWAFNPAIPRVQIEALAQGDFIRRKQNVVFVGQSGLGKSRLIQSIGLAACMLEYPVRYITSGELLEDLTAALADQTIHSRVRHYARFSMLVIDLC
jgi:DNA replication protein DnaC